MDKQEFKDACYEVLEILKYVKKEDLEKIPKEEIKILKEYANYNHNFQYGPNKHIKEQEVLKLTKGIIAQYFYQYTATDKQKEKIRLKQQYDLQTIEKEKEKNYDYSKMFEKEQRTYEDEKSENILPIEYKKERWYVRIFNKILKFFRG